VKDYRRFVLGVLACALSVGQNLSQAPTTLAQGAKAPLLPLRPGVRINADAQAGSCGKAACVPLCQEARTPSPSHPDWSWEYNTSCVIPGTPTALVVGGDAVTATQNHGYAVPPQPCTFGEPSPNYLHPPALDKKRLKSKTFTTSGQQLLDPYGAPFVPRAINTPNGWYDVCGQYAALGALAQIAATGANAVRIGWAFDSIDPGGPLEGAAVKRVVGTNSDLLAEILFQVVAHNLIPILVPNDSTGQQDPSWAAQLAARITTPKYLRVFKAYEAYLLLGIANELNVPLDTFTQTYKTAINSVRKAGLEAPVVVTANEWGQGCDSLLTFAPLIVANDPRHNVLFDLHVYTYVHYRQEAEPNKYAGGEPHRIAGCLDDLAELGVPLLVGEFGNSHSSGAVAWETIIARTNANGQGYAPWLWFGDTEYPQLNMNETWLGPLTQWGHQAIADFHTSAKPASIFRP
jgi:mannan endo-1,4-beta-mannosidase